MRSHACNASGDILIVCLHIRDTWHVAKQRESIFIQNRSLILHIFYLSTITFSVISQEIPVEVL